MLASTADVRQLSINGRSSLSNNFYSWLLFAFIAAASMLATGSQHLIMKRLDVLWTTIFARRFPYRFGKLTRSASVKVKSQAINLTANASSNMAAGNLSVNDHSALMRKSSRRKARATITIHASAHGEPVTEVSSWDSTSRVLVAAASIPFSLLVLPQVLQNFANISAGRPQALEVISWLAYTTALLGNSLMLSHFATRQENNAVGVQLLGIFSNLLVLSQVAYAGHMPAAVFAAVCVFVVVCCIFNFSRLLGWISTSSLANGLSLWRGWQMAVGVLGCAMMPQVLWNTFFPAIQSLLPGTVAAGAVASWLLWQVVFANDLTGLDAVVDSLPGWSATLMFALAPLPQLVRNFADPHTLAGLSTGTMVLALIGNALMLPRALLTCDKVWLAGTLWGCMASGWAQLLSMTVGVSAAGSRFLHPVAFAAISALLMAYIWVVLSRDAAVKKLSSPWAALVEGFAGRGSG